MIEPYASGENWTLYHADALIALFNLPDESVDLLLTDPPYSSGGLMRSDRAAATSAKYHRSDPEAKFEDFAGDNKDQRSQAHWCMVWLAQAYRILRNDRLAMLWSDWRQLPLTTDVLQGAGFIWRGIGDWNKGPSARPRRGGLRQHSEYLAWGSKGALRDEVEGAQLPCGMGSWTRATNADVKAHTAAKPIPILLELLELTAPGETVLDPFVGSGTTGQAALLSGRKFIGIEIVEYWAERAALRLEEAEAGATPATMGEHRAGQGALL